MAFNSDYFDLADWKITLPVDRDGSTEGKAVEVQNLEGFEDDRHFYDAPDGGMVFQAGVDGATTSGSRYARSELREMIDGEKAAWNLAEGGTMSATLSVDEVPKRFDGSNGRIIVGQIHGQDQELVRLYWDDGTVYFRNDQAGPSDKELTFTFSDEDGRAPQIDLGETFSYVIDARGDTLSVAVIADGTTYTSVTSINDVWNDDTFYFKAGAYLGVNETQGEGIGRVTFRGLDVSHTPGEGLGGLVPANDDGTPGTDGETPPSEPEDGDTTGPGDPIPEPKEAGATFAGTSSDDRLEGGTGDDTFYGRSGDDALDGGAGDDTLWGNSGSDVLTGGTGNDWLKGGDGIDQYVFEAGHGQDTVHQFRPGETLTLVDSRFADAEDVLAALRQTSDGFVLETGGDGSILFTDTSLSDLTRGHIELVQTKTPSEVTVPEHDEADDTQRLRGGKGEDELRGGSGSDVLKGRGGSDLIAGGDGDDRLIGGGGADKLAGGEGADTFVFRKPGHSRNCDPDTILDFTSGEDIIDLSAIDADPSTSFDDAFSFIGTDAFTAPGQLRIGDDGMLLGNCDSDIHADFAIVIGPAAITEGDFLL